VVMQRSHQVPLGAGWFDSCWLLSRRLNMHLGEPLRTLLSTKSLRESLEVNKLDPRRYSVDNTNSQPWKSQIGAEHKAFPTVQIQNVPFYSTNKSHIAHFL
jgi:hypothetical protein